MTFRAFGAPHRYMQGPDALAELKGLAALYGRRPFVVADAVVAELLGDRLRAELDGAGHATFGLFGGECTAAEIETLASAARAAQADVIIGVGGGKAIDTAKGVRMALGIPIIIVPTIASNDSPTSRLAVLYREDHVLSEVRLMTASPDVVLVDTSIIVQAPVRFFIAGIGDALSKKFEVEQCAAVGGTNFFKGSPTRLALRIADACYGIIRAEGEAAVQAVRNHETTEAVENAIEASILMSGLAFESGGLSIAHSLTRGFSAVPEIARALHGEQVALGLLVQLVAEGRDPAFLNDLRDFYRRIGLPTSLAAFGVSDPGAVETIVQTSWQTAPYIKNFTHPLSPQILHTAFMTLA
ncbi:glycerol dehydrogenase [Ancylobacter aquaticus]|uniref:Glycerol dehydrogenase n=1 Tax=Ancylobacter aquaticus TaxID=100 RepID=A0A4R1HQA9_ANCAQ|nr:glycerol dehydrogenase [Ancylobacter aquaticus]TCK23431.1 glycerol dehydrogenase [Ancylobacter aquaticus]